MEKFRLVYIDDRIDYSLTGYLRECFKNTTIEYDEREFKNIETYSDLLNDELVKAANVILIDSRLFENSRVINKKFTGEEFQILLTKIYPFKKVFVISQNEDEYGVGFIRKTDLEENDEIKEYYDKNLKPKIEDAIKRIKIEKKLVNDMCGKKEIDSVIMEQIKNALEGSCVYDQLTSEDIDKVIDLFNQLKL